MQKDVFLTIFCPKLDVRDVLSCCAINKEYYRYLKESMLWFYLCSRDFGITTDPTLQFYKTCHRLRLFAKDVSKLKNNQWMDSGSRQVCPDAPVSELLTIEYITSLSNRSEWSRHGLPRHIQVLPKLLFLRLDCCNFDCIPKSIFQIVSLTALDLGHNHISNVSCQISKLTNMKKLHLQGNYLIDLPKTLVDLIQLEELHVDSNRLKTLSSWLNKLQHLSVLSAMNNKLSYIPRSLAEISSLTHLYVGYNRLTSVPRQFGLGSLTYLGTAGNEILIVPPELRKFRDQ